jgi:hypothetical protein
MDQVRKEFNKDSISILQLIFKAISRIWDTIIPLFERGEGVSYSNKSISNYRNGFKTSYKFFVFPLLLLLFMMVSNISAQDIEQITKSPIVRTNGGISVSQISNFRNDSTDREQDFSYYLSGNLNCNLFGVVDLPFSFAYTNNEATANTPQPFNRLSIAPSYKWIKAYAGYSSLSFSPYTLAGHEFLGGGVELTPDSAVKFAAMYGRLKKASLPDSTSGNSAYRRMGGGFKMDYLHKKADAGFSLFKASDDANSVVFEEGDSTYIKPKDNLAGSAYLNLKLVEGMVMRIEYGVSILNEDISIRDSLQLLAKDNLVLTQGDVSTHHAFKSSVSQKTKIGSMGATYERISPNYTTLGAYYFNNDFENITANFSTSIKQWLNFAMDAGFQHDNLQDQRTNESSRFIMSANASSRLSKKLMANLAFSNVQSYTHIKSAYDEINRTNEFQYLDTLSFTQLNMTTSANLGYAIKSTKDNRQNINAGFTYQEASEQQEDDSRFVGSRIYNSMLSYQYSLIPIRLNISTTLNHNHNQMPENYLGILSYNLSLQKAFFEQLKASFVGTFSKTFNNEGNIADVYNLRVTGGYTLAKKHNFNLSLAMINNNGLNGRQVEYSANIAYNYIFNFNVQRENKKFGFEGSF